MSAIKNVFAREILDSRGNPTVEAAIVLDDGTTGTASCPSGASTGKYEAVELRDNDKNRYNGQGVLRAVEHVNANLAAAIKGLDATDQKKIDAVMIELDGTLNKAKLGANAMLSVSMAVCKAAAENSKLSLFHHIEHLSRRHPSGEQRRHLPTPIFNILNGGLHAGKNIDFQEVMVIPAKNTPFASSLQLVTRLYHLLKTVLREKNLSTLVGDEGGFAPVLASNIDALELLFDVVKRAGLELGRQVSLGIDVASNTFYKNGSYHIKDMPSPLSPSEFISYYNDLVNEYKLSYIEDGLSEDDFDNWNKLASTLSAQTLVVGDDLTVTNPNRLQKAIDKKAINAIIIKPNQIGTVSETIEVVSLAKQNDIKTIVSHRSGETNDDFIADFAVGVQSDFVKFGAPARGERVAKYNRLLAIEQEFLSTSDGGSPE